MKKRFIELLCENYKETMSTQSRIIEDAFANWIGYNKQPDDVTVLGIRI